MHVLVGGLQRPPLRQSVFLAKIALRSRPTAARAVNPKPLHCSLARERMILSHPLDEYVGRVGRIQLNTQDSKLCARIKRLWTHDTDSVHS